MHCSVYVMVQSSRFDRFRSEKTYAYRPFNMHAAHTAATHRPRQYIRCRVHYGYFFLSLCWLYRQINVNQMRNEAINSETKNQDQNHTSVMNSSIQLEYENNLFKY